MMDKSFFRNPVAEYFGWLRTKIRYQYQNRNGHLRIGYMNVLNNVRFGKYNWTSDRVIMQNVILGDFSYVSDSCVLLEATIGKFCSIGPNVRIAPGSHPTNTFVSTNPLLFSYVPYFQKNFLDKDYFKTERRVTIGNDVWICANAVIADGVTIGDGAVIAANAVVNRNVAPYSIVGGVPAKHIRYRFEPQEVAFLVDLKWWDKSIEWIEQNVTHFIDIKDFINIKRAENE